MEIKMNFIPSIFKRQELVNSKDLANLNLDKPFIVEKYVDKVIRHLANAIIETNRNYKTQHDIKLIFNSGYDETSWSGGSNYYLPIKMHMNEIDFEVRLCVELKSKGYTISNREYRDDRRIIYFTINW